MSRFYRSQNIAPCLQPTETEGGGGLCPRAAITTTLKMCCRVRLRGNTTTLGRFEKTERRKFWRPPLVGRNDVPVVSIIDAGNCFLR